MQIKIKKMLSMAGFFLWWMGFVFVGETLTDGKYSLIDLSIYYICLAPPIIFAGYLLRRKNKKGEGFN